MIKTKHTTIDFIKLNEIPPYTIGLSKALEDPEWDSFVEQTAGGHHVQTALWGHLKTSIGWQVARILVWENELLLGGAQILIRRLPLGFKLAYVSKGPLFCQLTPPLMQLTLKALQDVMKRERIISLIVQPPDNDTLFTSELTRFGYSPSPISIGVDATVKVDLSLDTKELMGQMKSKTRYNVRLGGRKGVTVVEGTRDDLPEFYELMLSTGERQDFTPYPLAYFEKMWDLFEPRGYLKLFFTCYEGEKLSANLSIPFGDTVLYKKGAWAGQHGDLRPNEVMHWAVIEWSKAHGYHYYDFEGIEVEAARCALNNEPLPDSLHRSTSRFKLGFSDNAFILPPPQIYARSPLLRWGYRTALPWLTTKLPVKELLLRMRA